ncbi:uncharacterized protein LOC117598427 [Pangasianodon hypophthalmus]|uniref:uncharacterized protein LOC117598427 n=1 Tax=Pangasianodon hypophthalmus TaxID=310915 RepID=UPI00230832B4|nr:uncharacterized protein LOC117598427 [Pangasianodon hypophthalmus]
MHMHFVGFSLPTPPSSKRVEGVMQHFHLASDPNGVSLYKPSILKAWCMVAGEILYRHGGTLQLNHVQGEGAKVDVWIPIRGTSQQEGYHFHQTQWVTGTRVSSELFQAQGMTGVAHWNFHHLVDLKMPDVWLPESTGTLTVSLLSSFLGAHVEHQSEPESTGMLPVPSLSSPHGAHVKPQSELGTSYTPPLPMVASPASTCTGPVKTGGKAFVLDHKWWTAPMKEAIDVLLNKHHGKKDMLKFVNQEYTAVAQNSCTDLNSMLHPTTRLHIAQYVKHLAKLLNISSSLNTSPEKLIEGQQLWHSLTEGSETTSVPVVTMPPAVLNPPTSALTTPLTQETIERIVESIMERQQQPKQKKKQTKTCLACGQPKSHYESDGCFIHFFFL